MKNFLIALFFIVGIPLHAECTLNKHSLSATYQLNNKKSAEQTFRLWRHQGKVAHQYLEKNITEIWTQTTNQQIRPIRYFDISKRAIEYQPHDIKNHEKKYWSKKYQLVDEKFKAQFQLDKTEGKGCQEKQSFSLIHEGTRHQLVWLPALDLVEAYSVETQNTFKTWQLKSMVFELGEITAFFEVRDRYKTTDYIDIGDNENDPFLLKMVNVGFK